MPERLDPLQQDHVFYGKILSRYGTVSCRYLPGNAAREDVFTAWETVDEP